MTQSSPIFPFVFTGPQDWEALKCEIGITERNWLADKAHALAGETAPTVTKKEKPPPSGDRHDYQSLGIYWWPDPASVDGVPYLKRDGEINPEVYGFDRPRLDRCIQGVSFMTLHGWLSGEPEMSRIAVDWIRTWFLNPETRMNPHLEFAQHIPGHCEGRGIGLIETDAFVGLFDTLALLASSGEWAESEQHALLEWFCAYRDWFRTSAHGKAEETEHNNHGTWYDLQLMAYAAVTNQKDLIVRQWESKTRARVYSQITEDGRLPFEDVRTLSLTYNAYNIAAFIGSARLASFAGVPLSVVDSVEASRIKTLFLRAHPFLLGTESWNHQQIRPYTGMHLRWITYQFCKLFPEFDQIFATDPESNLLASLPRCQRLNPYVGEAQQQVAPNPKLSSR